MAENFVNQAIAYVRNMEPEEREEAAGALAGVIQHLVNRLQGNNAPPPAMPSPLDKQIQLAKRILEVEKARIQFLKDNNIPEDSPMAEEVNVIFVDHMNRLKLRQ